MLCSHNFISIFVDGRICPTSWIVVCDTKIWKVFQSTTFAEVDYKAIMLGSTAYFQSVVVYLCDTTQSIVVAIGGCPRNGYEVSIVLIYSGTSDCVIVHKVFTGSILSVFW